MTIRFYMLQAHYRSTVDFSNEALQASEKAFAKLMNSVQLLEKIVASPSSSVDIIALEKNCYDAMNDDLNTAIVISHLFEASRIIYSADAGTEKVSKADIDLLKNIFEKFVFGILGLRNEKKTNDSDTDGLMNLVLSIRDDAKAKKDFATSDKIRDELNKLNFVIKDGKDGAAWSKS